MKSFIKNKTVHGDKTYDTTSAFIHIIQKTRLDRKIQLITYEPEK